VYKIKSLYLLKNNNNNHYKMFFIPYYNIVHISDSRKRLQNKINSFKINEDKKIFFF